MRGKNRCAALLALSALAAPASAQLRGQEPLLRVSDPAGDAHGDGSAQLPTGPAIAPEALDLRSFEVWPRGRFLSFRTEFGALQNPWNAPAGFSAQTLDIFIGTRSGGESTLADLNLRTEGGGWQYHLRVTGQGARWTHASEAPAAGVNAPPDEDPPSPALPPAPQVRTEGNTLVIDTELPRGRYAYWVTSSVYSPMSAGGVLVPGGSGPFAVKVPAGHTSVPVPLDVLAEEASPQPFNLGQLAPVGRLNDFRPWLLWGLGLLGLGLAAGASIALWRTPREEVVKKLA
ncbi:glucodextranase DOMON-like domain-containing protein [Deinococcus sp. SL84]|uniref:glucodextranase DOMON-like domain-containing protein n=1 Tax=Deinococcus sp. SL84 TaxID=2994663 RepID=UPI002275BDEA|nr:glucodextranase DOMON-like domain-containing protein [Deinococcus sp. SL84]MCY1701920.1 regulator [Deinococcus sp. SL84]